MSEAHKTTEDYQAPGLYEIRVQGHLNHRWDAWFEGLTIRLEDNGNTLITGLVVDQAALYGVLRTVRDFGMPLISVNRIASGHSER